MALRCGVAGLNRGKRFVEAFRAIDGCEVCSVCEPDAQRVTDLEGVEAFDDFETFLEKSGLDIVAIITPGPLHFDQTLIALERGVHVLCETPPVYSVDEAWAVVRKVRETGLKYMLCEDYIWHGWVERVKELIDDGRLGDIVYAEGDYTHDCRGIMLFDDKGRVPFEEKERHANAHKAWRATHLPPLSYCSHTLGPLLHLMQDRIVTAVGMDAGPHTWPEVCASDLQAGLFRTEKCSVIRLTNGFCVAHPFALTYNLCGTRGSIKLSKVGGQSVVAAFDNGKAWEPLELPWNDRRDGRPFLEVVLEQFAESVRRDTKPPLDVCESMDCVVPGLCAIESARKGSRPVRVPDFRTG